MPTIKDTSYQAHRAGIDKLFPSQKERLYSYIKNHAGQTRAELSKQTGIATNVICPRVSELLKETPPRLKELTPRACNITGKYAAPLTVNVATMEQQKLFA